MRNRLITELINRGVVFVTLDGEKLKVQRGDNIYLSPPRINGRKITHIIIDDCVEKVEETPPTNNKKGKKKRHILPFYLGSKRRF